MIELRKFQREFVLRATSSNVDTAALSLPRGNGKSWLAGHLAARVMTPGDSLFRAGTESIVLAATLEQGRIVFRFMRELLGEDRDYRWADSLTRVQVVHKPTRTALIVRGANAKATFGLVNTPWVIADEPGAWKVLDGAVMFDAIQTAQGKPGSPLTALYIGTLAPSLGGWWHDLVERGTGASTYVKLLQGARESWDKWPTIRKANPLTAIAPEFRRKLLEERNAARGDSRLKSRFLSYRLNIPTADESQILLTAEEWRAAENRVPAEPDGRPIVAVDLGGGRAWSAAVAIWQSGRVDAIALAPGIPDLQAQERRDTIPSGVYRRLFADGSLRVAEGLQVQAPGQLWDFITERWGIPVSVICDRFRLGELRDSIGRACPVEGRVTRWSEAASDVRALRKIVRDGPLTVNPMAKLMFRASLAVATVKSDDAGNTRLVKRDKDNKARDDVAAALLLAGGAFQRAGSAPVRKLSYASV